VRCAIPTRASLVHGGLIVGSVLLAINQGDALLAGAWSPALLWKIPLIYSVPFIVATWGALGASRASRR
jgi:hypothetical protein